ncbi:type II secretion system F family protein [Tessaracoccus sp. OS52]|uniref:type II secretion system F family protein n=1 Tax=Tessaracoccus sp. OS52 TaxID=2886691 RepID=UPI001D125855|nr:type II secretion system F family protein [Tessaracoccus sp. OS52]MCC2592891.1 type II secretion system F family protein [Tessaracoccus sp. OS52]
MDIPWNIILAAVLAGAALGGAAWLAWDAFDPVRRRIMSNLHRGTMAKANEEEQDSGGSAPRPRGNFLAAMAHRATPGLIRRVLERQYLLAGRPTAWPLEKLLILKLLWIPTAAILTSLVIRSEGPPLLTLVALVVSLVGYFLPELLLNSNGQKRNETIELELADTLDQMMISVEAGLGFDASMSLAAHNGKGPLAEELKRTFQDIQIGRSRRQAFEALTQRTTVNDLRRFVRAVIQADAYGISISDVLRTQATEMRLKRRQRAEEKAQKIPVKVLMPLMLFILPVLFIVVLGPAVMGMVEAFSNM